MKHTPGPWTVEGIDLIMRDKLFIASVEPPRPVIKRPIHTIRQANARLISAGPELLEALELAIQVGVARLCTSEQIDQIERAIAKARGEQ